MTSAALAWGSAFLAFGPVGALLFMIAYQKAQLFIVVTTSAFAFLLSALVASMVWYIFHVIGVNHPILVLVPGVMAQFVLRCGFVYMYHKVEKVIQVSIENHEQERRQAQLLQSAPSEEIDINESARLRLELNDWACGLAAGTGFAGMHAVLFFGTLLASEAGNLGTLYQDSCPSMPGLLLSALNAFFFTVLDIIWMLLTFFGMRRRTSTEMDVNRAMGSYFGNSKKSGNTALVATAVTHLAASFATTPNHFGGGCSVSIPLLATVVVATVVLFRVGVAKIYLPASQRRRSAQAAARHD